MKKVNFLLVLLICTPLFLVAQEKKDSVPPSPWKTGASLGLDFSQLLQINPRQGAGQNRVGAGTAVAIFAKLKKKKRLSWDNRASWQFGVQRLGSGPLASGENLPFQKAIDELRLGSKLGLRTADSSKFFYAADVSFLSQLAPAYKGTKEYPGNFLSDISGQTTPLARFFSPATITTSLGIDYNPVDELSVYYSPIGGKFIVVANDSIAALGVHGNPVTKDADGKITEFENVFAQLGSLLKFNYTDKYAKEKITFVSNLALYSNYLKNPQNLDLDWTNELGYTIFKGLQLAMTLNVFYDDDVMVQITDWDAVGGVSGLGKRVSLTQQLLIKYNLTF